MAKEDVKKVLDTLRSEHEPFKDKSDRQILQDLYKQSGFTGQEGEMTEEQLLSALKQTNMVEEFGEGLQRGLPLTGALATKLAPAAVLETLGFGMEAKKFNEDFQQFAQDLYRENPQAVAGVEDVEDVSDAGRLIASTVGEGISDFALMLGGGVSGGATGAAIFAARQTAQQAAKKSITENLKSFAKDLGEDQIQKTSFKKWVDTGGTAGIAAPSVATNIGESYLNMIQEGEADEGDKAIVAGMVKGALDFVGPARLLKGTFGGLGDAFIGKVAEKGLRKIGIEGVKTAGIEGLTEASQEAIDIAAVNFVKENPDVFTRKNILNMVNAGIAGALTGGTVGAAVQGATQIAQKVIEGGPEQKSVDQVLSDMGKETEEVNLEQYEENITEMYPERTEFENEAAAFNASKTKEDYIESIQTVQRNSTAENPISETATKTLNDAAVKQGVEAEKKILQGREAIKDTNEVTGPSRPVSTYKVDDGLIDTPNLTRTRLNGKLIRTAVEDPAVNTVVAPAGSEISVTSTPSGDITEISVPEGLDVSDPDKFRDTDKFNVNFSIPELDMNVSDYRPTTVQTPTGAAQSIYNDAEDIRLKQAIEPQVQDAIDGTTVFTPQGQALSNEANLRYVPLTREQKAKVDPYRQRIKESIQNIAPNTQVNFVQQIEAVENDEVLGPVKTAQLGNVLYVAVDFNSKSQFSDFQTALQEVFHTLYNTPGFFTNAEKQTLKSQLPKIKKYIEDKLGYASADMELIGDNGASFETLVSSAFALYAGEVLPADSSVTTDGKLGAVNRVFKKIINFLKQISSRLRRQGDFRNLFDETIKGRQPAEAIEAALEPQRFARMKTARQEMLDKRQANLIKDKLLPMQPLETFKQNLKQSKYKQVTKDDAIGKMIHLQRVGRMLSSMPGVASSSKFVSDVVNFFVRQENDRSNIDAFMNQAVQNLMDDPKLFSNGMAVVDLMNNTGQELTVDRNGQVLYIRDGKVRRASPELSNKIREINDFFDMILDSYKNVIQTSLESMGHGSENTVESIQRIIDGIASQEEVTQSDQNQIDTLLGYQENLNDINRFKESNVPYFPHIRFGDHAVLARDPETKEIVYLRYIQRDKMTNKFDKKELDQIDKEIKDLEDKMDVKLKVSDPFKLTYNEMNKRLDLSDAAFNVELLTSLLQSVPQDTYTQIVDKLEQSKKGQGASRFFRSREGYEGYSKDYARVLASYGSSFSRFFTNQKYAMEGAAIRNAVASYSGDTELQSWLQEFIDYMQSPSADWEVARMFNFFYALGGNIATATLQLVTTNTVTPAVLSQLQGNMLTNGAMVLKAQKDASQFMLRHYTTFDRKALEREFPKDEAEMIQRAVDNGLLKPGLVEDMIGTAHSPTESKRARSLKGARKVGQALATPITTAETLSRFATYLAAYRTLKSKKNQEKMRQVYQNDERFNSMMQYRDSEPIEYVMSEFIVDETHAIFGKVGRNRNQRGAFGSLIFPFMTHPLQQMELFMRMAFKRKGEGRTAMLSLLAALFILTGLQGLPGEELMKELLEKAIGFVGPEVDIDFELRKALAGSEFISPEFASMIQKGVGYPWLQSDVSRRIQPPFFFQPALVTALSGRTDVASFVGTQGSALVNVFKNTEAVRRGDIDPADFMINSFTPIAFQNLWQSFQLGTKGYRTKSSGDPIIAPEDVTRQMKLVEAIGFQPRQLSEEYLFRNAERLGKSGYLNGYNRIRRRIVNKEEDRRNAVAEGDNKKAEELQNEIRDLYNDAREFSERAGRPFDYRKYKAFKKSIEDQLKQRKDPTYNPQRPSYIDAEAMREILLVD